MNNMFYKMKKYFKKVDPDFFAFLTADINLDVNVKEELRNETYSNRGNYSVMQSLSGGD